MIVLDTHIWIRWVDPLADPLPGPIIARVEAADEVAVSAISCWEVAWLARRGRVKFNIPIDEWLQCALEESGIHCLAIDREVATLAARLPEHHRDPADRLIIATAIRANAQLASLDTAFPAYRELDGLLFQR